MPVAESSTLHLRFGKTSHEIDATTLAVCLLETQTTIEQIGITEFGIFKLEMKVKAFQKGSFEVPIEFIAFVAGAIYHANEVLPHAKDYLSFFIEYLKLKKFLKGESPAATRRDGEQIVITAGDGATITVNNNTYNFHQTNTIANTSTARQFKQLEQDNTVESFEVTDGERTPLFQSERQDFSRIGHTEQFLKEEIFTETKTVDLCIQKPVLDKKKSSWGFIHEGMPVTAKMKDQEFLDRIEQGEQFAMGDRLHAEMEIKREFDSSLQVHRIKSRQITKVLGHTPRPPQGEFDFHSES